MVQDKLQLSHWNSEEKVSVPGHIVTDLKLFQLNGVRFLYNCYIKKLKGTILNQESGMNSPIQITAFLTAISAKLNKPILIFAPNTTISMWHYHLINHGKFLVKLLNEEKSACFTFKIPEVTVVLASFSDINLLKSFLDSDFSVTVIDALDEVAKRLVVRKIRGDFNIGVTYRNFMLNPDMNLLWKMLHWCDPNSIGKIAPFYESAFDEEYNLCDPYCNHWMRMTWDYCESFEEESPNEKDEYRDKLNAWALENNLLIFTADSSTINNKKTVRNKKGKKRNHKRELLSPEENKSPENVTSGGDGEIKNEILNADTDSNLLAENNSSCDTIVSDNDYSCYSEYVKLPSMDENPILTSIIKNFECPLDTQSSYNSSGFAGNKSPEKRTTEEGACASRNVLPFLFDAPSTSKPSDSFTKYEEDSENDILTSIITSEKKTQRGENANKSDYSLSVYDLEKQKAKILSQLELDDF